MKHKVGKRHEAKVFWPIYLIFLVPDLLVPVFFWGSLEILIDVQLIIGIINFVVNSPDMRQDLQT